MPVSTGKCPRCGFDPGAPPRGPRWSFVIACDLLSQNVLAQNKGAARWRYKRWRGQAELLLRNQKNLLRIPDAVDIVREVRVTRWMGLEQREYDHGNLVGGAKPLIDAMVTVKLLVDDTSRWTRIEYEQGRRQDTSDSCTGIHLEDR